MDLTPPQEYFDQKLIDGLVHYYGDIEPGDPVALSHSRLLHCLFLMPFPQIVLLLSYIGREQLIEEDWRDISKHYGDVVKQYIEDHS